MERGQPPGQAEWARKTKQWPKSSDSTNEVYHLIQSMRSSTWFNQRIQAMDSILGLKRWGHAMVSINACNQWIQVWVQSIDSISSSDRWIIQLIQPISPINGFNQWTPSMHSIDIFNQWIQSMDSMPSMNTLHSIIMQSIHTMDSINGFVQLC